MIDTEWAADELRRFAQMTELHPAPQRPGITQFGEGRLATREPNSVIVQAEVGCTC